MSEQKKPKTVQQNVHERHERCPKLCGKLDIPACEYCGGVGLVLVALDLNYSRTLVVEDA